MMALILVLAAAAPRPSSTPQMAANGAVIGLLLGTTVGAVAAGGMDCSRACDVPAMVFLGSAVGGLVGGGVLGAALSDHFTAGDAAAMSSGMLFGSALPPLTLWTFASHYQNQAPYVALGVGGLLAGMISGPLLNSKLHWSGTRWNLITLGGALGVLGGLAASSVAGVGQAAPGETMTSGRSAFLVGGSLVGLIVAGLLTSGLEPEYR